MLRFGVPPGKMISPGLNVMPSITISPGAAFTYNGLTVGTVISSNGQTATVRLEGANGLVEFDRPTRVSMGTAAPPPPELDEIDAERLRRMYKE